MIEVTEGIPVRSNTRGHEDPIRTFVLPIEVIEVESSINCGFRAQWGVVDIDGDTLEVCSGAGMGSSWATISFRGKQYAISAAKLTEAFLREVAPDVSLD